MKSIFGATQLYGGLKDSGVDIAALADMPWPTLKSEEWKVFAFDIADHAAVKMALGTEVDARVPDAVVYNAGIIKDNLFVFMTKEEWDSVLHTNLDGFYNVMHTVIFSMLREKRGRIVVISSTSGEIGQAW